MIRFLLSAVACACVFTSCGPLDGGGDPLDGPPGTDGGSLHLRTSPDSSGSTGMIGGDSRYDRY